MVPNAYLYVNHGVSVARQVPRHRHQAPGSLLPASPLEAQPKGQDEEGDLDRPQDRLGNVEPLLWLTERLGHLGALERRDADAVYRSASLKPPKAPGLVP